MTLEALQALRKILAYMDNTGAEWRTVQGYCGDINGGLCGLRDQVDRETVRWEKAKHGNF